MGACARLQPGLGLCRPFRTYSGNAWGSSPYRGRVGAQIDSWRVEPDGVADRWSRRARPTLTGGSHAETLNSEGKAQRPQLWQERAAFLDVHIACESRLHVSSSTASPLSRGSCRLCFSFFWCRISLLTARQVCRHRSLDEGEQKCNRLVRQRIHPV